MSMDLFPAPSSAAGGAVDVTDRPARLLGIVELSTDGTAPGGYDARQIRALTAADVVSAVQSGAWSVSILGAITVDTDTPLAVDADQGTIAWLLARQVELLEQILLTVS